MEPRYTSEHAKAGLDFAFPAIETWQNQFPGYEILIDDPELTSVCPKTGLPDLACSHPLYAARQVPGAQVAQGVPVQLPQSGIFQENIVNQFLEDLVKASDPVWAVVRGEFSRAAGSDHGRRRAGRGRRLRVATCSGVAGALRAIGR